jgi:signal transduction histidine kinase
MLSFFKKDAPASPENVQPLAHDEIASVLYGLEDAVIAYTKEFVITMVNPSAERLFGIPANELMGMAIKPQHAQDARFKRLAQVIYPSLAPVMVPRSALGAYPQLIDVSFEDPPLELRITTAPMRDATGVITGFMKLMRDRTREVELLRSKSDFITIASHQLRTPLTEISWALESVAGTPTLDDNSKQLLARTLESVRTLIRTTEDLLGVAKIEEGRFGYQFAAVDIRAFLDELLGKLLPVVQGAGLQLYFDRGQGDLPPVYMDKEKISMVVNNLVENAVRYNVPHGEITVSVEVVPTEPYVRVSVKDTGIGIPPEAVNSMFNRFFRADNARKAVANGSGLGLYIAKNIIQSHGGQIGVSSEVNRGSTFYFTLTTDQRRVPQHETPVE